MVNLSTNSGFIPQPNGADKGAKASPAPTAAAPAATPTVATNAALPFNPQQMMFTAMPNPMMMQFNPMMMMPPQFTHGPAVHGVAMPDGSFAVLPQQQPLPIPMGSNQPQPILFNPAMFAQMMSMPQMQPYQMYPQMMTTSSLANHSIAPLAISQPAMPVSEAELLGPPPAFVPESPTTHEKEAEKKNEQDTKTINSTIVAPAAAATTAAASASTKRDISSYSLDEALQYALNPPKPQPWTQELNDICNNPSFLSAMGIKPSAATTAASVSTAKSVVTTAATTAAVATAASVTTSQSAKIKAEDDEKSKVEKFNKFIAANTEKLKTNYFVFSPKDNLPTDVRSLAGPLPNGDFLVINNGVGGYIYVAIFHSDHKVAKAKVNIGNFRLDMALEDRKSLHAYCKNNEYRLVSAEMSKNFKDLVATGIMSDSVPHIIFDNLSQREKEDLTHLVFNYNIPIAGMVYLVEAIDNGIAAMISSCKAGEAGYTIKDYSISRGVKTVLFGKEGFKIVEPVASNAKIKAVKESVQKAVDANPKPDYASRARTDALAEKFYAAHQAELRECWFICSSDKFSKEVIAGLNQKVTLDMDKEMIMDKTSEDGKFIYFAILPKADCGSAFYKVEIPEAFRERNAKGVHFVEEGNRIDSIIVLD